MGFDVLLVLDLVGGGDTVIFLIFRALVSTHFIFYSSVFLVSPVTSFLHARIDGARSTLDIPSLIWCRVHSSQQARSVHVLQVSPVHRTRHRSLSMFFRQSLSFRPPSKALSRSPSPRHLTVNKVTIRREGVNINARDSSHRLECDENRVIVLELYAAFYSPCVERLFQE